MNIRKSIILRIRIVFVAICLLAMLVVVRIGEIQYVDGEKWTKMANDISLKYQNVEATRGNIYSDNGSLLATSLPLYRVAFDPTVSSEDYFEENLDSLAYCLSRFYKDRSKAHYKQKIYDARKLKRKYIVLNRTTINYQDKKDMTQWPMFRAGRLRGGGNF